MRIYRIYFLAGIFLLLVSAVPHVIPAIVSAQDGMDFQPLPEENEIDLESLELPTQPTPPAPPVINAPPTPPPLTGSNAQVPPPLPPTMPGMEEETGSDVSEGYLPLAPFEPTPPTVERPEEISEPDSEIEQMLLDLAKEGKLEGGEQEADRAEETVVKPDLVESAPRPKWWQKENPYKNQMLPEVIYKKDYDKKNQHLPKAYDLSDLDRWLFDTAADGDVNGTRAILNKNIDPDPRNSYGNTPLILAALNCREGTVRLLLARGANPNVQNKLGLSAMHIAAYKGCIDIVKALVSMGANPNIKSNQGFTPIEFAATNKHFGTAQVLLDNGAKRTSRFFSGMIHEKSSLDAVTRGKASRKDLPSDLPSMTGSDEMEDAEILQEALGVSPDNTNNQQQQGAATGVSGDIKNGDNSASGSPSQANQQGYIPSPPDSNIGADKNGANNISKLDGVSNTESGSEDSLWRPTKGGGWIKIGGQEPPQGVAGIYWYKDNNIWTPLDKHDPEQNQKIQELKARLGHNGSSIPVNEGANALPSEVIEDLGPRPGVDVVPTQGAGDAWWQEIDGEWRKLDPGVPSEAAEIEKLKKLYGKEVAPIPALTPAPTTTQPTPAPVVPPDNPVLPLPVPQSMQKAPVEIKTPIMPSAPKGDIPITPKIDENSNVPPSLEEFEPLPEIPLPEESQTEIYLEPLEDEEDFMPPLPALPDLPPLSN